MWQPKRATKRHTTACSSQNYYKALFNIQLTERKFISGVLELHTVRVETIYHEQATVEDRVWTTRSDFVLAKWYDKKTLRHRVSQHYSPL